MQPDKTNAIRRIKPPTTVDEIRTFLGSVGFYRRFIPRLGMLAAPMHDGLKKGAKLDLAAIAEACEAIKSYLVSDAVVSPPDFRDPKAHFVLVPDASDVAAGAAQQPTISPHRPEYTNLHRCSDGSGPRATTWPSGPFACKIHA